MRHQPFLYSRGLYSRIRLWHHGLKHLKHKNFILYQYSYLALLYALSHIAHALFAFTKHDNSAYVPAHHRSMSRDVDST